MNEVITLIKELNIQTIVPMIAIMWYFTRDLRNQILNLEKDMKEDRLETHKKCEAMNHRTDKLYEMFISLLKDNKRNRH